MPVHQLGNFDEIAPNKRLATGKPNCIEFRELAKDPFDLGKFEIAFGIHFPRVAHDATGVAGEGHGVSEEPRQPGPADCGTE